MSSKEFADRSWESGHVLAEWRTTPVPHSHPAPSRGLDASMDHLPGQKLLQELTWPISTSHTCLMPGPASHAK